MKLLSLLLAVIFLASCGKCRDKFYCKIDKSISLSFDGFAASELDTINVRWYEPGTGFSELAASQQYVSPTAVAYGTILREKRAQVCYDTIVELPAVNKQYRFTDFKFDGKTEREMSYYCEEKPYTVCRYDLASFNLDGVDYLSDKARLQK